MSPSQKPIVSPFHEAYASSSAVWSRPSVYTRRMSLTISLIRSVCCGETMNSCRNGSVNQRGVPGGRQSLIGSYSPPVR